MTTHNCNQGEKFDELTKGIEEVRADLAGHREKQQEQDAEREKHREEQQAHDKAIDAKLDLLSSQMYNLIELNADVSNIKIAWNVGTTFGGKLVKFTIGMTIIFGAIYAVKEWIKK